MKRFKFRRRTWVLLGVLTVAAVAAVSGYAYFAASGSGSGTATVATIGGPNITSDPVVGLWPDSTWHALNVDVNNPNAGNLYVTSVSGTVADNGACLGSWFEVQTIPVAAYVAPGDNAFAGSVRMLFNNAVNQSVCSGTPMTINWTSN